MALISIEEICRDEHDTFQASVSFNHGPRYSILITNPFSLEQEKEIEWYYEAYPRFPFTEEVRARNAAASITSYGETLFNQVFADRQVYSIYKECLQNGLSTMQIEIAGTPVFHSFHWEALKDPDLPTPLSLQIAIVRKNLHPSTLQAIVRPSPTLNLLIVTARPYGRQDVGYRTISRPLVEALRQTDLPIQIVVLRPGTYQALDHHLQETTIRHGIGYYHVIHFDVHGAVLTFQEFQRGQRVNRFLYQDRYGRVDMVPYKDEKAFIFFEDVQDGKADPVEASELAALLLTHHIPVAILNACQSGKQVGASETSLGSHLMQSGVQLVLAMGYSITVSAAELLMRTLYKKLFAKHELSTAISIARRELYNYKTRRVHYDETLDLEDWLLPVVYQNQPVKLNTRPMTTEELIRLHERDANRYISPQPIYGFVGRDLDVLEIEKRLLCKRNVLLIHGMGGSGKTILLHHLGSWWQTTQFVEQVFYFGYDERPWTRQQIIINVARKLISKEEYLTSFQPLSIDAQQSLLTKRLQAQRHLLILDNLELITGTHLAIKHTLSKREQEALHNFIRDLAGGLTFVLLGSRGSEAWLAPQTFVDNVYNLPGLDLEAASVLAERILERHGATKYRQDKHLPKLLSLLNGFPLALEVVLSNLAQQNPAEILAALQAGDVELNSGNSQKRTENILRCIDYSHSNLSPQTQSLLTCLAPFTSIIFENIFNPYSELLRKHVVLADLPLDGWQEVLEEVSNWGLAKKDSEQPAFLNLHPILPYFLRTRLNTPGQREVHRAIEAAFLELYIQFGIQLYDLLTTKNSQEIQRGLLIIQYEYENLLFAAKLALNDQISINIPYTVLSEYFDLIQDPQRGIQMSEEIWNCLTSAKIKSSDQVNEQMLSTIFDDLARWHLHLKHYNEAEEYYLKALQIFIRANDRSSQASIHGQLGQIALEQYKLELATEHFKQSLQFFLEADDHEKLGPAYDKLGLMSLKTGEFEQAKEYYLKSLHFFLECNDRRGQAIVYHQLGLIAQELNEFKQAEEYLQQALQIFIEYDDRRFQSNTYHNLSKVARGLGKLEQAEEYLRRDLLISIDSNDLYTQASAYCRLSDIAQDQLKFEQAEQYLQKALLIYCEYGDHLSQISTYHELGLVAIKRCKFELAEEYLQQTLLKYNEPYCRYYQAISYQLLGIVAEKQHHWEKAQAVYFKALDNLVEYDDINNTRVVLNGLARLWKVTGEKNLLPHVALVLKCSQDEVESLFFKMLESRPNETED